MVKKQILLDWGWEFLGPLLFEENATKHAFLIMVLAFCSAQMASAQLVFQEPWGHSWEMDMPHYYEEPLSALIKEITKTDKMFEEAPGLYKTRREEVFVEIDDELNVFVLFFEDGVLELKERLGKLTKSLRPQEYPQYCVYPILTPTGERYKRECLYREFYVDLDESQKEDINPDDDTHVLASFNDGTLKGFDYVTEGQKGDGSDWVMHGGLIQLRGKVSPESVKKK